MSCRFKNEALKSCAGQQRELWIATVTTVPNMSPVRGGKQNCKKSEGGGGVKRFFLDFPANKQCFQEPLGKMCFHFFRVMFRNFFLTKGSGPPVTPDLGVRGNPDPQSGCYRGPYPRNPRSGFVMSSEFGISPDHSRAISKNAQTPVDSILWEASVTEK